MMEGEKDGGSDVWLCFTVNRVAIFVDRLYALHRLHLLHLLHRRARVQHHQYAQPLALVLVLPELLACVNLTVWATLHQLNAVSAKTPASSATCSACPAGISTNGCFCSTGIAPICGCEASGSLCC
uniref:Uncharacterized protein n=1 Tax=Acrobeloides nanus TaxID=290746 RepID=A0A914DPX0_9BILA